MDVNQAIMESASAIAKATEALVNAAAVAQEATFSNTSVIQPNIPEMGAYWNNANPMGQALVNGEINADNAAAKTEEWNAGLNNTGL